VGAAPSASPVTASAAVRLPFRSGPETGLLLLGGLVSITGLILVAAMWRRERRRPPPQAAAVAQAVPATLSPPPMSRSTDDDEANVPRWLRQSLRQERFAQPVMRRMAVVSTRGPLTFEEPESDAIARMVLRYDGVSLLDQPNESFARTLTVLGTADEVDILEVTDAWAFIRTPNGMSGWLPSMTLRGKPTAAESPYGRPPEPDGSGARLPDGAGVASLRGHN